MKKELSEAKSLIIFSSSHISHKTFEEFREQLAKINVKLRFVKNTLFKVAASELKLPKSLYEPKILTGPTSLIYVLGDDFISAIKALTEKFGGTENVQVKIALLDKEIYDQSQVLEFSKIPTALQLQAKLTAILNNPLQKLHSVLSHDLGKLVRSLSQIAKKGDEQVNGRK